jgi:hypothetical protein
MIRKQQGIALWDFIGLSKPARELIAGKAGSDQDFAFWLRYALNVPQLYKIARTPEEKKLMKTAFDKAVRMLGEATKNDDEKFFERWARGRKMLKAVDPLRSRDPRNFLLAAYDFCTADGRKTNKTEVIQIAKRFMAVARINGPLNVIPLSWPTEEQIATKIKQDDLDTIGWHAYLNKLGLKFPDKGKRGRPKGWRKH